MYVLYKAKYTGYSVHTTFIFLENFLIFKILILQEVQIVIPGSMPVARTFFYEHYPFSHNLNTISSSRTPLKIGGPSQSILGVTLL